MATTNYEAANLMTASMPQTFNSLQQLIITMASCAKHKDKVSWWGKNKSRKAYVRFERELHNTIVAMFMDEVLPRNASSNQIREQLIIVIGGFSEIFPNWQDAYNYATAFFIQTQTRANETIESLVKQERF